MIKDCKQGAACRNSFWILDNTQMEAAPMLATGHKQGKHLGMLPLLLCDGLCSQAYMTLDKTPGVMQASAVPTQRDIP